MYKMADFYCFLSSQFQRLNIHFEGTFGFFDDTPIPTFIFKVTVKTLEKPIKNASIAVIASKIFSIVYCSHISQILNLNIFEDFVFDAFFKK